MPFLLLTHLQLPLIHISKSWSPAVSWRTENTVWNIEPTGSSQNQKSLDRDLPTEFVNHYVARLRRVGSFEPLEFSDVNFTAQCCVLYSSQTNCILYCANNLWGNHSPSIITIPKLCSTPQIISKVSLCNFSKPFQVGVVLLKLNWICPKTLYYCSSVLWVGRNAGETTQLYLSWKEGFALVFLACLANDVEYMGLVFQQVNITFSQVK